MCSTTAALYNTFSLPINRCCDWLHNYEVRWRFSFLSWIYQVMLLFLILRMHVSFRRIWQQRKWQKSSNNPILILLNFQFVYSRYLSLYHKSSTVICLPGSRRNTVDHNIVNIILRTLCEDQCVGSNSCKGGGLWNNEKLHYLREGEEREEGKRQTDSQT